MKFLFDQPVSLMLVLTAVAGLGLASGCGRDTHSIAANRSDNEIVSEPVVAKTVVPTSQPPAQPIASDRVESNQQAASPTISSESPADKTRLRNITFDTLKFEIEKGEKFERDMLSPAIEKLDGRRVRIKGFMLPTSMQSGLKRFILVRDNLECCFGPGAALFDSISIAMAEGETASYSYPPIAVEGTFRIHLVKNPFFGRPSPPGRPKENSHMSIFTIEAAGVK